MVVGVSPTAQGGLDYLRCGPWASWSRLPGWELLSEAHLPREPLVLSATPAGYPTHTLPDQHAVLPSQQLSREAQVCCPVLQLSEPSPFYHGETEAKLRVAAPAAAGGGGPSLSLPAPRLPLLPAMDTGGRAGTTSDGASLESLACECSIWFP